MDNLFKYTLLLLALGSSIGILGGFLLQDASERHFYMIMLVISCGFLYVGTAVEKNRQR